MVKLYFHWKQSFYCYSSGQASICSWEQTKISSFLIGSFCPPSPVLCLPSSLPINSFEPFSLWSTCNYTMVFMTFCSWRSLSFVPTPSTPSLLPLSLEWPSFLKSYFITFSSLTEAWISAVLYKATSHGVLTKNKLYCALNKHLATWNNRNTVLRTA